MLTPGTPPAIARLVRHPATLTLARVALTSAYWLGGLVKLTDFAGARAEMAHFGLAPTAAYAAATIAVELAGSALVIAGRAVWLGAGMLAVFTVLATLRAHAFWTVVGPERAMAFNAFFEHLGLVAGFVLVTALASSARPPSASR